MPRLIERLIVLLLVVVVALCVAILPKLDSNAILICVDFSAVYGVSPVFAGFRHVFIFRFSILEHEVVWSISRYGR